MENFSYLLTGAAGGIGSAIAARIARADPRSSLILVGRNSKALESLRRELPRSEAHSIIEADLRDRDAFVRALRAARPEKKNLKAVIANAGMGGENHYGSGDRWDEILATNLTGTYLVVQEALAGLRRGRAEYRQIVVISSILARLGVPGYSAYCASKAGLLGLTRSLAAELASEKILVNAICPGWVDTPMAGEGMAAMAEASGRSLAEVCAGELGRVPLNKMSTPAEIAALVQFLVSDQQCSITGQALDINGGAVMA